jgi:hypothetical protein
VTASLYTKPEIYKLHHVYKETSNRTNGVLMAAIDAVWSSCDVHVVQFPGFLIVRGLGGRAEWRNELNLSTCIQLP